MPSRRVLLPGGARACRARPVGGNGGWCKQLRAREPIAAGLSPFRPEGSTTAPATWPLVALAYFVVLAAVAWLGPRSARARAASALGLAVALALAWAVRSDAWAALPLSLQAIVPVPVLLLGYLVSGRFYRAPMRWLEARLAAVDQRVLVATGLLQVYRQATPAWRSSLEIAYLLVHPMVPAGALVVAGTGSPADLDRFWTPVLLAGLASYAALPWIQTRPPRAFEDGVSRGGGVRGVNLAILRHAGIGANTVPSGHAACAVAVALAVTTLAPPAGPAFLVLAAAVCTAAVLGRYHFLVDVLLGVALAVIACGVT